MGEKQQRQSSFLALVSPRLCKRRNNAVSSPRPQPSIKFQSDSVTYLTNNNKGRDSPKSITKNGVFPQNAFIKKPTIVSQEDSEEEEESEEDEGSEEEEEVDEKKNGENGERRLAEILVLNVDDSEQEHQQKETRNDTRSSSGASSSYYHRSQSPAMHSTSAASAGLHVVQLKASPTRLPPSAQKSSGSLGSDSAINSSRNGGLISCHSSSSTCSPMRVRQPPPLFPNSGDQPKRSVWVTRQFVAAPSLAMHQQQMQQRQMMQAMTTMGMLEANGHYQYHQNSHPPQYHHIHSTPVVARSNSSAATAPQMTNNVDGVNNNNTTTTNNYSNIHPFYAVSTNTNSLPRLSAAAAACNHQQQLIPNATTTIQIQADGMGPMKVLQQNGFSAKDFSGLNSTLNRELPNNYCCGGNSVLSTAEMQLRAEWSEQQRRRLYRIALNFFNKKPDRGVYLLMRWGFVDDNARAIARLFRERRGLSRQMIGEYLGTLRSTFHAEVLDYFISDMFSQQKSDTPVYNMEVDIALRQLLKNFRLPGEAQKIDHIIQTFAHRYVDFNAHRLTPGDSADTMYILAFAIIMLNTDLHTPSLKDSFRMKLDEFIKNLCRVEESKDLDRKMLAGIYERVKEFEFRTDPDHVTQVSDIDQKITNKEKPKLVEPHRRLICYCRVHQIIDPNRRQSSSVHQREIFLFNDMILVCKQIGGRKHSSSRNKNEQYQLRHSSFLIGLHVELFQNSIYQSGIMLTFPGGEIMMFNAKNDDDRSRLAADIRESVAESTEMEHWRVQFEIERQQQKQQPST